MAVPGSSPRHFENFDLFLNIVPRGDELVMEVTYNTGLFEAATLVRWLSHYDTLLRAIVASAPGVRVGEMRWWCRRRSWRCWRVGIPRGCSGIRRRRWCRCLGRLVVGLDAVAVQFGDREVSYAEFERLARRVAGRLVELGVGRGSLVGVLCERSVELVAAVHGVVMAGAAYVPLDPEYPPDRLDYMVGETGMRVVLCQGALSGMIERADVTMVDLEQLLADDGETDFEPVAVDPDDLAYVIYTSGSTGRPKGVANAHRGVVNRLLWMQDRYGLEPGDVVLQKTPFSFDVSVWELFWPLQVGARLVIAEPGGHRDPAYLVQTIVRHGVDTIHFVPSMLRLFLEHPAAASCTSLRRVICSGEALARDLQDRFFAVLPGAELHNLYGPTEAAIDVTAWQCRPEDPRRVVPIGAPIANTTIHILDDRLQAGADRRPGRAAHRRRAGRGRVRQPARADGRAVHPRPVRPARRGCTRPATWRAGCPTDRSSSSAASTTRSSSAANASSSARSKRCCYSIPTSRRSWSWRARTGPGTSASSLISPRRRTILQGSCRRFGPGCGKRFPNTWCPRTSFRVGAIPLTPSGKVDRKSLPAPDSEAVARETQHVAPRTSTESRIAAIWADALGIASPGIHDDFFDLGGHSLMAAQVVTRHCVRHSASTRPCGTCSSGLRSQAWHEIIDVLAVSAGDGGRQRDDAAQRTRGDRDLMLCIAESTLSTSEFLSNLRERDVRLWVEDGRLKCDAPPGVLEDGLRSELAARKQELLTVIAEVNSSLREPRSLVPLKPTGDRPPLFARPGHNGDVFCYRALAEHLDPRQPLYGVEPRGLDGDSHRGDGRGDGRLRGCADPGAPARGAIPHRGLLRWWGHHLRVGEATRPSG